MDHPNQIVDACDGGVEDVVAWHVLISEIHVPHIARDTNDGIAQGHPNKHGATLLADPRTCMPTTLEYANGPNSYRIDPSQFRRYDSILFPTVLRTSKNGQPWTEEDVSEVRVDIPIEVEFFRQ
jgi:hypothetical protein